MCHTHSNTRKGSNRMASASLIIVNPNLSAVLNSEDSNITLMQMHRDLTDGLNAVNNFSSADLATWLIRNRRWQVATANDQWRTKYQMVLNMNKYQNQLQVFDNKKNVYTGTFSGYNLVPAKASTLGGLSGKTVRFRYNGGTTPNQYRVVKVSDEDGTHLKGTDLVQNAPRSYMLSKIDVASLQEVK